MWEVLSNIIDNVLKYIFIKGNIYIKLVIVVLEFNYYKLIKSKIEEMLVIVVSDIGYGILLEDLEYLFEWNYWGEKVKINILGIGLGLVIVCDLINEM